jgi:hypothetical protein
MSVTYYLNGITYHNFDKPSSISKIDSCLSEVHKVLTESTVQNVNLSNKFVYYALITS